MASGRSIITIGNFDGVHAGHAALIARCRQLAGDADPPPRIVALVFDPHPLTRLRPDAAPARIMPFERRADLLRALGVDEVVLLSPTDGLLSRTPEQFITAQTEAYRPIAFVEGDDFHFGKGRAGNADTLRELGRRLDFAVSIVPPVEIVLSDHTIARASSSLIRWLLARGRTTDAALVLGRPHELTGIVGPGDRRGRTIGFPTANLHTPALLPADGVYAARAILPSGAAFPAAVNVGPRPTFEGMDRRVEAHLIGAPRQDHTPALAGLPEYGWALKLELHAFLRDQTRFASVGDLTAQLARDTARAAAILHAPAPPPPRSPDLAREPIACP